MLVQENLAAEFDRFSNNYTEDMINCVPHYQKLLRCFVDFLPPKLEAKFILDLGSGNGNSMSVVYDQYPSAKYTLVDASPEMHRICQDRFPNAEMTCIQSYFNEVQFAENSFDLVTACFSLHHIDAVEKANIFGKIEKWIRPGGLFISSDLMIDKDESAHPTLLKEWENFVKSNHDTDEKWDWIKEHYDTFDKPSNFHSQLKWLQEAGFINAGILWQKGYWTSISAQKPPTD